MGSSLPRVKFNLTLLDSTIKSMPSSPDLVLFHHETIFICWVTVHLCQVSNFGENVSAMETVLRDEMLSKTENACKLKAARQ